MFSATWGDFSSAGIEDGPRMLKKKGSVTAEEKLQSGLCLPVFKELDMVY